MPNLTGQTVESTWVLANPKVSLRVGDIGYGPQITSLTDLVNGKVWTFRPGPLWQLLPSADYATRIEPLCFDFLDSAEVTDTSMVLRWRKRENFALQQSAIALAEGVGGLGLVNGGRLLPISSKVDPGGIGLANGGTLLFNDTRRPVVRKEQEATIGKSRPGGKAFLGLASGGRLKRKSDPDFVVEIKIEIQEDGSVKITPFMTLTARQSAWWLNAPLLRVAKVSEQDRLHACIFGDSFRDDPCNLNFRTPGFPNPIAFPVGGMHTLPVGCYFDKSLDAYADHDTLWWRVMGDDPFVDKDILYRGDGDGLTVGMRSYPQSFTTQSAKSYRPSYSFFLSATKGGWRQVATQFRALAKPSWWPVRYKDNTAISDAARNDINFIFPAAPRVDENEVPSGDTSARYAEEVSDMARLATGVTSLARPGVVPVVYHWYLGQQVGDDQTGWPGITAKAALPAALATMASAGMMPCLYTFPKSYQPLVTGTPFSELQKADGSPLAALNDLQGQGQFPFTTYNVDMTVAANRVAMAQYHIGWVNNPSIPNVYGYYTDAWARVFKDRDNMDPRYASSGAESAGRNAYVQLMRQSTGPTIELGEYMSPTELIVFGGTKENFWTAAFRLVSYGYFTAAILGDRVKGYNIDQCVVFPRRTTDSVNPTQAGVGTRTAVEFVHRGYVPGVNYDPHWGPDARPLRSAPGTSEEEDAFWAMMDAYIYAWDFPEVREFLAFGRPDPSRELEGAWLKAWEEQDAVALLAEPPHVTAFVTDDAPGRVLWLVTNYSDDTKTLSLLPGSRWKTYSLDGNRVITEGTADKSFSPYQVKAFEVLS